PASRPTRAPAASHPVPTHALPIFYVLGEAETVAAAFGRDLRKLRRLQCHRFLGAVEFEKERRLLRIGQAGIGVAGADLQLVENRSEEHTSALPSREHRGCRLLLRK